MGGRSEKQILTALGKRIRLMRLARDWTHEDVAERSGIDPGHLSEIENAKINPSAVMLVRLLDTFEVPANELLVREHGAPPPKEAAAAFTAPIVDVPGILETVGARVRFYRKAARLVSAQIADATGVSLSTLHAIEHATRAVALETYLIVAKRLGLSLDGLFRAAPQEYVRALRLPGERVAPSTTSKRGKSERRS